MDDLIKDADEYCDAVAEFIRSKGITRCPTACVLPTQGLIAAADRIALERHALVRNRVRRERAAARWGRLKKDEQFTGLGLPGFGTRVNGFSAQRLKSFVGWWLQA